MSNFCFIWYIHTHTFKYHFHYYHTYMTRDKKVKTPQADHYAKKVTHSLYQGLATPGVLHGITVTKKVVTRLSVIFPFLNMF